MTDDAAPVGAGRGMCCILLDGVVLSLAAPGRGR